MPILNLDQAEQISHTTQTTQKIDTLATCFDEISIIIWPDHAITHYISSCFLYEYVGTQNLHSIYRTFFQWYRSWWHFFRVKFVLILWTFFNLNFFYNFFFDNYLGQHFLEPKLTQIFIGHRIKFWPKIILRPNLFLPQIILYNRPKIVFEPKSLLEPKLSFKPTCIFF